MSNLDKEIIIRRLAIIKYLYNLGAQQSMQVDMVAGFSILSFHDCAEMFLLLVAENKGMKGENVFILKSATKLFSVLLASKRPLITELADKLRLKYPLLPTISPCPTMRLEAIRSIIPISCRRYPKSV